MTASSQNPSRTIDLLCVRDGDSWRVYVWSLWMLPAYLRERFGWQGEAHRVALDFEDLSRRLAQQGVACDTRRSINDDVQLEARGQAAHVVVQWLGTAFASDIQLVDGSANQATRG